MSLISCCQPDFPWACGTGLEAEARESMPTLCRKDQGGSGALTSIVSLSSTLPLHAFSFPGCSWSCSLVGGPCLFS